MPIIHPIYVHLWQHPLLAWEILSRFVIPPQSERYLYFWGNQTSLTRWKYWAPHVGRVLWVFQDAEFVLVWVTFFDIIRANTTKNMSKIKDIVDKMKTQWSVYSDFKLLIAQRVWLLVASIYFLAYLFTVGGFYFGPMSLDILSKTTFHLYSVLVIATGWMIYALWDYAITVYAPSQKWTLFLPIIFSTALIVGALVVHLGLYNVW